MSSHIDLDSSDIYFKDFINCKNFPYDDNGHGTAVCGIIAGDGRISNGNFTGINSNANIIMLKVINKQGRFILTDLIDALSWIEENYISMQIKIITLSLGYDSKYINDPIKKKIKSLYNKNIIIITSSGNNINEITAPGEMNEVLTVGNTKIKWNNIEKPDINIPYKQIVTLSNKTNFIFYDMYTKVSGSSFAAAIVAGEAYKLLTQNPHLSNTEMYSILKEMFISSF